jgi:glucose/arabinose dehydrogenase
MNRQVLLALSTALLLFATSLPQSTAQPSDPGPSKAPFTPSGNVQGVSLEQIATGLGGVTSITNAGDGRLFLTLREGRIVIFENGAVRPQDFLDIRGLINSNGFERGLLSVAFHPNYDQNGFFFVNYTNVNGDTAVARYQVSSDPNRADAGSARVLLTISQPFPNHNGGQLQFGPDGYLYIGMGDGGSAFDPNCNAQKTDTLLGKILRIDVDQNVNSAPFYGIPLDNPFRGGGNPPDEVWSSGFRNPWRFSFDRQTGDLWIGDVGQNRREEIDFQPASSDGGENYGWKVMEGTLCSTTDACPTSTPACNSPAFTAPVLEYDHDPHCSVTGGYVYRGSRLAQLRGSYIFGDFCSGVVWAASRQGDGFQVRTISGTAAQLSTFGEDAQGELYAATLSGRLLRLTGQGSNGGKAETVGLFIPQSSLFQLKAANTASASIQTVRFGQANAGWLPLAGDWNGDGKTTIGLYDPETGIFRLKNTSQGRRADVILRVDAPSPDALPIAGDWDGDGDDTVGLYDPATSEFLLKNSLSGSGFDVTGTFPDVPGSDLIAIAGDWNGDGVDTVGLFDPRESIFYLENGTPAAQPDVVLQFGPRGRNSLPVIGDWNGDGVDGVGVYDPASATFRLKNALSAGNPDLIFRFGPRRGGWLPIAGAW